MESLAIPFENIAEGLESIYNSIKLIPNRVLNIMQNLDQLIKYINPLSDDFFIKKAFIPSEGYFDSYFTDIKTVFDSKFPLITQIHDLLQTIANVSISGNIPEFTVTLNEKYGGGTYNIIDFSYFTQYRDYILTFNRVAMWFFFVKHLYRQLPNMIYK